MTKPSLDTVYRAVVSMAVVFMAGVWAVEHFATAAEVASLGECVDWNTGALWQLINGHPENIKPPPSCRKR